MPHFLGNAGHRNRIIFYIPQGGCFKHGFVFKRGMAVGRFFTYALEFMKHQMITKTILLKQCT